MLLQPGRTALMVHVRIAPRGTLLRRGAAPAESRAQRQARYADFPKFRALRLPGRELGRLLLLARPPARAHVLGELARSAVAVPLAVDSLGPPSTQ